MRTRGLGLEQFATAWSSSADAYIGTVEHLLEVLADILREERELDCARELPEHAVAPSPRRRTLKELGTPTPQAEILKSEYKSLSHEDLLEAAEEELVRLQAEGEVDVVADLQPDETPQFEDNSLLNKWLEIRWRYWETVSDEDDTLKLDEKGRKVPYYVWCEGQVIQVADGVTTKRSKDKRCTKILPAGAVRIRWPADAGRKEKETVGWTILNPKDFKREVILGWRWAARELSTPPRSK